MIFSNAIALWLAVAIPIVVYAYFIRRKTRERVVSSNFLWREVLARAATPTRGFRARNIVSLLLAATIATALVLAAARPSAKNAVDDSPLVVVLDNSASMSALEPNGESRFQRAKKTLAQIVANKSDARDVLLMTCGGAPNVQCGFTREHSALRGVVERLTPTSEPAAALETLRRALFFQRLRGDDARILFVSDGAFQDRDDVLALIRENPALAFLQIGESRDNVALLACEPRRSPTGDQSFETFVDVANFSENDVQVNVEFTLNGDLLDVLPLNLQSRERVRKIVKNESLDGGEFVARLAFNDAESDQSDGPNADLEDDVVVTTLAPFPTVNVLLYGDVDQYVATALQAQPNATVSVVDAIPAALDENDLLVIVGDAPDALPSGKIAFVSPASDSAIFTLGDEIEETFVEDAQDSGLTRYANLSGRTLRGVRELRPAEGYVATVYAKTPEAPVALEIAPSDPRDVSRFYVLNFATADASVALQTLFPIVFTNLVGAARGVQDQDWNAIRSRSVAESDLRVDPALFAGLGNEVEALARVKRPIWSALAIVALILTLAEFYLYCRRRVE